MWYEGLLFKLMFMGISGELYNLLGNYHSGRFQRVILNGQTLPWRPVMANVSQNSILDPLLFLVYVNPLDPVVSYLLAQNSLLMTLLFLL